jgi:hypothetical protein
VAFAPQSSPWARRRLVALRLTAVGALTAVTVLVVLISVVGVGRSGAVAPVNPTSGDMRDIASRRPGLRVLFIGNSLTYVNSLPSMVQEFAAHDPGATPIYDYEYAPGGAWLYQAAASATLWRLLTGHRWNAVVLQEDSHVTDKSGYASMYSVPAARQLDDLIGMSRARPVVYETWGYRNGNIALSPSDSYPLMQARAQQAALTLRTALRAELAPVGYAWSEALRLDPSADLWQADNVHPSPLGTYLAAAVFYDVLTGRDPISSHYDAGLDPGTAHWLRTVARIAVAQVEPDGPTRPRLPAIRNNPWFDAGG